jgi:hypothetical protein
MDITTTFLVLILQQRNTAMTLLEAWMVGYRSATRYVNLNTKIEAAVTLILKMWWFYPL